MRLICERCHRRWTLQPGKKRRSKCPVCCLRIASAAARRGQIARRRLRDARREVFPPGPCPSPEELQKLTSDMDAAAERAIQAATSVAAGLEAKKNRPGG